jgi:hypothetical protein
VRPKLADAHQHRVDRVRVAERHAQQRDAVNELAQDLARVGSTPLP